MQRLSVAMIGLDAVGTNLISLLKRVGPACEALANELEHSVIAYIEPVPPYTPAVWTSMLSGVNPAKHGIAGFQRIERGRIGFHIRVNTAHDVSHPRIWEILELNRVRSVIVNAPLTWPTSAMLVRDFTVVVSGWDSPRVEIHPIEAERRFGQYFDDYLSDWSSYVGRRARHYVERAALGALKRMQGVLELVEHHEPDYLFYLVSEFDWIAHVTELSFETCRHSIEGLCSALTSFLRAIAKRFDAVIAVSDHDMLWFSTAVNLYAALRAVAESLGLDVRDLISIEPKKRRLQPLTKALTMSVLGRAVYDSTAARRLLTAVLRAVGGYELVYRCVYLGEPLAGIYVSRSSVCVELGRRLVEYLRPLGLDYVESDKVFSGPLMHVMPDYVLKSLGSALAMQVGDRRAVLKSARAEHGGYGVLAALRGLELLSEVADRGEVIKPWTVALWIFKLLNVAPPSTVDCRDLAREYGLELRRYGAWWLHKRIRSISLSASGLQHR